MVFEAVTKGIILTNRQRIAWLRLIRSENIGPITFRDLINHFGSAEAAINALPDLSRRGGSSKKLYITSQDDAENELNLIERFEARIVGIGEPDYPPLLRHIAGAPPLLTIKGNAALFHKPVIGIVGSRNASINGVKFASIVAKELGMNGYTIISGLARGIDAAAHKASIQTGTIATLAGGINRPYPAENVYLLNTIYENDGVAISEMPYDLEQRARDFPRRNRLIAGVSLGVIITEAAQKSGSLITARIAGDFGRLVFAVPGSPLDPRSFGTNALIRDGATLITCTEDVLEALRPLDQRALNFAQAEPIDVAPYAASYEPDESDRAVITSALGPSPVEIDDIIRHTGISASAVHLILLELDLAGRLQRYSSGRVSLIVDS